MRNSNSFDAHLSAVANVLRILSANRMVPQQTGDNTVVFNGRNYAVTTNTKDNAHTECHFFTTRQLKELEENPLLDGVIVYHTGSDSCVIFPEVNMFVNAISSTIHFKHYTKTVKNEDGESVKKSTYVPFYLSSYKNLCSEYGYLTMPDNMMAMDKFVNSKYQKKYHK